MPTKLTHECLPVLQARIFSYPDAQRYRLSSPNYQQLPPNRPINKVYAPYQRDGPGTINGNYGGDPDYVGSEFLPVSVAKRRQMPTHEQWEGHVIPFATQLTEKDFVQPRELWEIICGEPDGKKLFLENILPTIAPVPEKLQKEVLGEFVLFCIPWSFQRCS